MSLGLSVSKKVILTSVMFLLSLMIIPSSAFGGGAPSAGLAECIDCADLESHIKTIAIERMEKLVDKKNDWDDFHNPDDDDYDGGGGGNNGGNDHDNGDSDNDDDHRGKQGKGAGGNGGGNYCGGCFSCSGSAGDDDDDGGDDDNADDDDVADDDDYGDDDDYFDDDSADDDDYFDDDSADDDDGDSQNHSDTNVQEAGVDEDDIIKTDGEFLYLASGGFLIIFDVNPPQEPRELGRVDIEGIVTGMYLYKELAVIFSNLDGYGIPSDFWDDAGDKGLAPSVSKITMVNIARKFNPVIYRETYYEGKIIDTRRIADKMHVVINGEKSGPELQYRLSGSYHLEEAFIAAIEELKRKNREKIENSTLDQWLGRQHDIRHMFTRPMVNKQFITPCDGHFHPSEDRGVSILTVLTYGLDENPVETESVSIMGDGLILYASHEYLYLTDNILSAREFWMDSPEDFPPQSQIHVFDIHTAPGTAIYTTSQEVPGFVLNQFSMSEFDGYFRVATTSGFDYWSSSSGVYVFKQEDGVLAVTGAIEGIAFTEELYAARFIRDKGYLVTYPIPMPEEDEFDPLFTVNLSDPYNPVLAGELEVPGFSTYIHPMGEHHLLTIGEGGDWVEAHGGVAMSIFDVTDFGRPRRIHFTDLGSWGVSSEAKFEHHAFLYYTPEDLLAIPLVMEAHGEEGTPFSGIFAFRATVVNGFELQAEIEHSLFEGEEGSDEYLSLSKPRRSAVIGDYLYTISDLGMVVSKLWDWSIEASFDLPWQKY